MTDEQMAVSVKKYSAESATKLTFVYDDSDEREVEVNIFCASEYLWSGEGLQQIYEESRVAYFGWPDKLDEDARASFDSWHLSKIKTVDGFILKE